MNKTTAVLLFTAGSVLGGTVQSQFPTAQVMAGIAMQHQYKAEGRVGQAVQSQLESGVGAKAIIQINSSNGLENDNAIDIDELRSVCMWWSVDKDGNRVLDWQAKSKQLEATLVRGAPQE